ncbi:helix-turn-helix transcriptional regulator [Aeromonas veronii]|jgi:transcriptional regulator with XRE-family HTH domain|uniref:helix-turn-helix domain-containing protein n=1 Tax=Aeromonas veronii TaxID=654 RepID=UPI00301D3369
MTHPHSNKRRKAASLQDIFARNVLFHRKRLELSQEALAERCSYHRTYIGSIERGERNVTIATIEALASVFGVHPYELLVPKEND